MCLGMNPDILQPGERCASTSNRNCEGRQGRGGRTHLVSPMMAAAAAIAGHFTDIRNWRVQYIGTGAFDACTAKRRPTVVWAGRGWGPGARITRVRLGRAPGALALRHTR